MAETLISPGVLARENDISFSNSTPVEVASAFIGPTVKGEVEVPTLITSYGEYQRKFGTTFESGSNKYEYLTSLSVRAFFSQGGTTALVTRVASGSFTAADNTTLTATTGSAPFSIATLGTGEIYNNATDANTIPENSDGSLVLGNSDNLRWEITSVNNARGTFALIVRRGDDSTKSKIIIETFNDLSLDPNSENFIAKVIGTQYRSKSVDGDGNIYVTQNGTYPARSNYIRVASVSRLTPNYLGNDGVTVGVDGNSVSYSGSLPVAQSGSFYNATGTLVQTARRANYNENISNTDTQGLLAADYADAISILTSDEYSYNVIVAPGLISNFGTHNTQVNSLVSLAESRGNCIFVTDLVQHGASVSNATAASSAINSSYVATYWPWVQMKSETGKDVWAPASTVIPGVYAFNDASGAPWFAPAGLVRGGIPTIIQAERILRTVDKNLLGAANINPIATFPGNGIAAFGQKTLQKKKSALDRINVRRLLIEIKSEISKMATELVFEQNTTATRNKFLHKANPYLDSVVQREGLYTYTIKMDQENNSNDVIDRQQLVGQIIIQPTRTIEYVLLDFVIEPTGATFPG